MPVSFTQQMRTEFAYVLIYHLFVARLLEVCWLYLSYSQVVNSLQSCVKTITAYIKWFLYAVIARWNKNIDFVSVFVADVELLRVDKSYLEFPHIGLILYSVTAVTENENC